MSGPTNEIHHATVSVPVRSQVAVSTPPRGQVALSTRPHAGVGVAAITGPPGPQGPPGQQGPQGDPGPQGPPGTGAVDPDITFIAYTGPGSDVDAPEVMTPGSHFLASPVTASSGNALPDGFPSSADVMVLTQASAVTPDIWGDGGRVDRIISQTMMVLDQGDPAPSWQRTLYHDPTRPAGMQYTYSGWSGTAVPNQSYIPVGSVLTAWGPNGGDYGWSSPLQARATAQANTTSLAPGTSAQVVIGLAIGYRLYTIKTSRPARVRLSATAAQRTADLSRPVGTNPASDAGVLLDYVTPDAAQHTLSPLVDGASLEAMPSTNIPLTVTNSDTVAGTVTVTLGWIRTE